MGVELYFPNTFREKPREKALRLGLSSLSDAELVALLLCTGDKSENVLDLSDRLLFEKGGLKGIFTATAPIETYGVKKAKSMRLAAVNEILRRLPFSEEEILVDSSSKAREISENFFRGRKDEVLLVLYLGKKKELLRRQAFTSGKSEEVFFPSEEILHEALITRTRFLILLHNHPSGQVTPSKMDTELTLSFLHQASLASIVLLDSLILTDKEVFSFRKEGLLSSSSS